jgi:long-chain acyl-CoA synthetase
MALNFVLKLILHTLDTAIWLMWPGFWMPWLWKQLKPIKSSVEHGEPGQRRRYGRELAKSPYPGVTTCYELLQRSWARYAELPCLGTRTYIGEYKPDEKMRFPLQMFGETVWETYSEFGARCHAFGCGLRQLGLQPFQGNKDAYERSRHPHTILLWEDTSAAWSTACYGAMTQSVVVATSYATLGVDAVVQAINESSAAAIVCNLKALKTVIDGGIVAKCPTLKNIIYTRLNCVSELEPPSSTPAGVKVMSLEDVVQLGQKNHIAPSPPTPETIAVLMYTSGSTGKPKGVMIQHDGIVATVAGMVEAQESMMDEGKEVYLGYLPAAHIFELTGQISMLANGTAIGFADPKTISSKGACRQTPSGGVNTQPGGAHPPGASEEFKPTIMVGVPKIWDTLRKGAEAELLKKPPMVRAIFQEALSARDRALQNGTDCPLFRLVFSPLRKMLGGRLKLCISGGGAIADETQSWIRAVMCPMMIQGYGLTETNAASVLQDYRDARNSIAGRPLASVEIKVVNCVDDTGMTFEPKFDSKGKCVNAAALDTTGRPYLATDTQHSKNTSDGIVTVACAGRGEVWIRGTPVSAGYFRQPDKTAEAYIVQDGVTWFRTGDIALWTPDGALQIIDRLKNMVKLKGGEYVALENMEKELNKCDFVSDINGGCWCIADDNMDRPGVVAQVDPLKVKRAAEAKGIDCKTDAELLAHPDVRKMVLASLQDCGKSGGLSALEIVQGCILLPGTGLPTELNDESPWTPANEGLTASNKLNRSILKNKLKHLIEQLYKDKGINR